MIRRPPKSTPFPTPTLFRSKALPRRSDRNVVARRRSIGGDGIAAALPDWLGWPVQNSPPEAAMKTIPWLAALVAAALATPAGDRKSTRLNSSHLVISYAVFC